MLRHKWCPARLRRVAATIEPEPSEAEREAILAALARPVERDSGWAETALLEGVEEVELDP